MAGSVRDWLRQQTDKGSDPTVLRKDLERLGAIDAQGAETAEMDRPFKDVYSAYKASRVDIGPAETPLKPEVGRMFDIRDRLTSQLATASEKALFVPRGDDPPAAAISPMFGADPKAAIAAGARRGLIPQELSPEQAADIWKKVALGDLPGPAGITPARALEFSEFYEEDSWGEDLKDFLGSIPKTAAAAIAMRYHRAGQALPEGSMGELLGGEEEVPPVPTEAIAAMGLGKAVPPGGRTVRRPTVLSTAFDVLTTLQRVGVTAPIEIAIGERNKPTVDRKGNVIHPGEGLWEHMGNALKLPSWSDQEPRDNVSMTRRNLADLGYDPNSVFGIAASMAAGFADPIMAIGGPRSPRVFKAAEQAMSVAKAGFRQLGMRGQILGQHMAELAPKVAATIREAGDLGAARQQVSALLADQVGDHAVPPFEALGTAWGEHGVLAGIPLLRGRRGGKGIRAQPELVSAQTIAKTGKAARAIAQRVPVVKQFSNMLAAARRALDPAAERGPVHEAWWQDYYRQRAMSQNEPDHLRRIATEQVDLIADEFTTMGAKGPKKNPVLMPSGEITARAADPHLVKQGESEYIMAGMNWPMRRSTERWAPNQYAETMGVVGDGTLLPDPALTGGPLKYQSPASRIIRQGYASAIIEGEKGASVDEAAIAFSEYVSAGLKNEGWKSGLPDQIAVDLLPKARQALDQDIPRYAKTWQNLGDRMRGGMEFHVDLEARLRAAEVAFVEPHAKRMARPLAKAAAAKAKEAGDTARSAGQAAKDAYNKEYRRIMGKVAGELDNHFTHIIRNREAVRIRYPHQAEPGTADGAKHREFVDIIENWEQGQDPVTDAFVTTAARVQAHANFMAQQEATRLVLSDKRWAVPAAESAGLRTKDGWQDFAHPLTGEKYSVRVEALKDLQRVIEGYKPGGFDALFRAVRDNIPWLGTPLSGWKARVTHGRLAYYNTRNMEDDAFRMWMSGYDGNPKTAKEAVQIMMQGDLEVVPPIRKHLQRVRRRGPKDEKLQLAFEQKLREQGQRTITQDGTGETVTYAEAYKQLAKYGVVDKGLTPMELMSVDRVQGTRAKRYSPLDLGWKDLNPLHKDNVVVGEGGFYLQTTGNISRWAENARRSTTAIAAWKRGETWQEAAHLTARWQFNYGERTDFLRKWVSPVSPFAVFTSKAIPAHLRGLRQNPGRYLAALQIPKRAFDKAAESKFGPVAVVQDYIDDGYMPRAPFQTAEGSPLFMGVGISANELNLLNPGLGSDTLGRAGFFDDITPIADLASLMITGRDPRTGKMLSNEWTEPDASLKWLVEKYNSTPGLNEKYKVPKSRRVRADGTPYYVYPAAMVWGYNKALPNIIAFTTTAFPKDDPFAAERQPYDQWKHTVGGVLPFHVNNPLRTEIQASSRLLEEIAPSVRGVEDVAKEEDQ